MYSTTEIAEMLGVDPWRISRLYESGSLEEPAKFAGRRVILGTAIPEIVDALRERNWLPPMSSETVTP